MAPHYPRVSDTISPFRSQPEAIALHPIRLHCAAQPGYAPAKESSVLAPLISLTFALLVMVAVALPMGRLIAATAARLLY